MNHNKTVLFLKLGSMWSFLIVFLFFILKLLQSLSLDSQDIENSMAWVIAIDSIAILILYSQEKKQTHVVTYNIEGIGTKFIFVDYYSRLLPAFLITFGLAISIISAIYDMNISLSLGILILYIGILSFFIIFTYLISYDVGLNLNLNICCMIFKNHLYKKDAIDSFLLQKFTHFFHDFLNSLDLKLNKGLKINNLTIDGYNLSIKSIVLYLPPYVKFGSKDEIEELKSNLGRMQEFLTQNNQLKSLKIMDCIVNIYKAEKEFILKYNYQIEPQNPLLRLYESIKSTLYVFIGLLILITISLYKNSDLLAPIFEFLQSESMKFYIQPLSVLLASLLSIGGTLLVLFISSDTKK